MRSLILCKKYFTPSIREIVTYVWTVTRLILYISMDKFVRALN